MSENETGDPMDAENADSGHNSRQAEMAEEYLLKIEAEDAKITAIQDKAKLEAAPHREAIAKIKKEMREETGVDIKAANDILALNKMSRKITGRVARQSENTRADFEVLYDKMGQGTFDLDSVLEETPSSD